MRIKTKNGKLIRKKDEKLSNILKLNEAKEFFNYFQIDLNYFHV